MSFRTTDKIKNKNKNFYSHINQLSQNQLNPFIGPSNVICSVFNMHPVHIDDLKEGQTQVNERLPFHNKLTVSAVNERGTVLTGTEPHYSVSEPTCCRSTILTLPVRHSSRISQSKQFSRFYNKC